MQNNPVEPAENLPDTKIQDSPVSGQKEAVRPVSEQKEAAVLSGIMKTSLSIERSGPLPSPEDFERYEKTLPGAGERILSMAERQQQHRFEIEKTLVKNETKKIDIEDRAMKEETVLEGRKSYIGLIIVLSCIIAGGICAFNHVSPGAITAIFSPVICYTTVVLGKTLTGFYSNRNKKNNK
ncbi:MAG: DUF2335 domain-containing protein [Thermoguttaceae bacterium]|nr:DUF2335 domain-containing protein [Thermoguttaceae bacterium]MBR6435562.1 DUF2335 domain-containing protein [Thermoguttaceae bacterium]